MFPAKPPSSAAIRARPSHPRVKIPDHILQQLIAVGESSDHKAETKNDSEENQFQKEYDRNSPSSSDEDQDTDQEDAKDMTKSGKNENLRRLLLSASSPSSSSSVQKTDTREPTMACDDATSWGALIAKSAELSALQAAEGATAAATITEQPTEDSLVSECSDLRSLQVKVQSITSELRCLESFYPTQTALVEVVADAVDELASALVTRHANHLARMMRDKSVEYTREATGHLLDQLRHLCSQRDDAVRRIAAVRAWRDQLSAAMLRQQGPVDARVEEQRVLLEKEERATQATMQHLRNTFEQNAQLISQIARSGPIEEQVHRALDEYQRASDEKDRVSNRVVNLWRETEVTRRKLVNEEQRAIDEARVLRAKQSMGARHLEDLNKMRSELAAERDKLASQLEELQKKTKSITAEFRRREGEAFEGWTPRPSFVDAVEAREEWVKKNEKTMLELQRRQARQQQQQQQQQQQPLPHHQQQQQQRKNAVVVSPLLSSIASATRTNSPTATALAMSSSSISTTNVPPAAILAKSKNSRNRSSTPTPSSTALASNHVAASPATTAVQAPAAVSASAANFVAAKIMNQISNSFVSPIFASIGVDTRGQSTSALADTLTAKITTTSRDVRRVNDEWKKIDRLTCAIHLPIRLLCDRVREGFDANVDTSDYLMRFMGASTVPSFLREPRPVVNEKWNFSQTEENCLEYLLTLSQTAKRVRSENKQHDEIILNIRGNNNISNTNNNNNNQPNSSSTSGVGATQAQTQTQAQQQDRNNQNAPAASRKHDSNQIRLQYETCVLRSLARCAAMSLSFDHHHQQQQQQQQQQQRGSPLGPTSGGGVFGGGDDDKSPSASPSAGESSLQFPAARKFGYHILHHGNLFKEYSPIIRAALMTFACSLPLEFIDAPLDLLRASMDRFVNVDLAGVAGNVLPHLFAAPTPAPPLAVTRSRQQQKQARNRSWRKSSVSTAAPQQQRQKKPSSFRKRGSETNIPSGNESGFDEDDDDDHGDNDVNETFICNYNYIEGNDDDDDDGDDDADVVAKTGINTASAASLHPALSSMLLSAFTVEFSNYSASSSSSPNPGNKKDSAPSSRSSCFGPIELLQLQHALQLDTTIGTFVHAMIVRKKKQQQQQQQQQVPSPKAAEATTEATTTPPPNMCFDFQAAIGVRPIRETDAPGLVLRLVIEFFLRRHDIFTRTLEQAVASFARPLGETSQMVVVEHELSRILSSVKVETWKCHAVLDGCVVHPSFVRAIDSLFIRHHQSTASTSSRAANNANTNTNNVKNSSSNATAQLSASSGNIFVASSIGSGNSNNNNNNNGSFLGSSSTLGNINAATSSSASSFSTLISCSGPPSKKFLKLKPSFVFDVLNREVPSVSISKSFPPVMAMMMMQPMTVDGGNELSEGTTDLSWRQHDDGVADGGGTTTTTTVPSVPRFFDLNDLITCLWTKSAVFCD